METWMPWVILGLFVLREFAGWTHWIWRRRNAQRLPIDTLFDAVAAGAIDSQTAAQIMACRGCGHYEAP